MGSDGWQRLDAAQGAMLSRGKIVRDLSKKVLDYFFLLLDYFLQVRDFFHELPQKGLIDRVLCLKIKDLGDVEPSFGDTATPSFIRFVQLAHGFSP